MQECGTMNNGFAFIATAFVERGYGHVFDICLIIDFFDFFCDVDVPFITNLDG